MMPIPQLVDGLSRGRMDVVATALRLHENEFLSKFIRNLKEGNAALVEEHINRMAILFESILNRAKKSEMDQLFSIKLLNYTLAHTRQLLKTLEETNYSVTLHQQKRAVLELLTFYIKEFGAVCCNTPVVGSSVPLMTQKKESRTKNAVTVTHFQEGISTSKSLFNQWSSMTDEEIIQDALGDRDALYYAKQILTSRGVRKADEIESLVESVANINVLKLLEKKQIDKAKDILWNTDNDVWPALKSIFMNTSNAPVRAILAPELESIDLMSTAELDAWKFLILVEDVIKDSNVKISSNGTQLKILKVEEAEEIGRGKTDTSMTQIVTLISQPDLKSIFIMELYFETQNSLLEPMLEKSDCWKFLLSTNRLDHLISWAQYSCEKNIPSQNLWSIESILSSWTITQEMVDYVEKASCSFSTKEKLLNYFSRYDMYTIEESTCMHKLLVREALNGRLTENLKDIVKRHLVQFCLRQNLPELLISCNISCEKGLSPWMDLYVDYQDCIKSDSYEAILLGCIIRSAEFFNLSASTDHWIPLTAVLLSAQPIRDALRCENSILCDFPSFPISKSDLQASLDYHPRLKAVITSSPDEIHKKISYNELLQEYFPLGAGYQQSLCSLFRNGAEENIPNFSSENLITDYGHHETLDYHYYLKQGRPCFAASLVLVDQILNAGRPSRKLLKKACSSAHGLAMSHFTNHQVTASCIAFTEMLGGVSLTLRSHIAAANLLLNSGSALNADFVKDQVNMDFLLKGLSGEHTRDAQMLFGIIEKRLPRDILSQGLIVQLAELHKLPFPLKFLSFCAENDDWMQFLLFSQIYNPPLAVLNIVKERFKSVAIKKHFEFFLNRCQASAKAFSSKVFNGASREQSPPKSPKSEPPDSVTKSVRISKKIVPTIDADHSVSNSHVSGPDGHVSDDLMGVLWLYLCTNNPERALMSASLSLPCPVLAVIAGCYMLNPLLHFCVWLASWFPPEERESNMSIVELDHQPAPEVVEHIILQSLASSCSNLHTAFYIFLPEHPLFYVVEVLENLRLKRNSDSVNILLNFQTSCQTVDTKSETDDHPFLSRGPYILNLGCKMIIRSLEQYFLSINEKYLLLRALCEAEFSFSSVQRTTDPKVLLKVLETLLKSGVQLNMSSYFNDCLKEGMHLISELINLKHFDLAKIIASTMGFKDDAIVIAEETNNFQNLLITSYLDFKYFCDHCDAVFVQTEVNPAAAFKFFYSCAEKLSSHLDRWLALRTSFKWLSLSSPYSEGRLEQLEVEIWDCCLVEDSKSFLHLLESELRHSALHTVCCEALGIDQPSRKQGCVHFNELEDTKKARLLILIGHILDIGDVVSAYRLKNLFGMNYQDLQILEVCLSLVEEYVAPEDVLEMFQAFPPLNDTATRNYRKQCHFIQEHKGQTMVPETESSDLDKNSFVDKFTVYCTIQQLCKQLAHGKEIGKQLIACYQLAVNMNLSYKEVTCVSDPVKLLRMALSEKSLNHFAVVSDIMIAFQLSAENRAEFLSREIIAALSKCCAMGLARDCMMWGYDVESHFNRVLELVPDPCLLGNELMCSVTKLLRTDKQKPREVLITTIELLVRAHDCYSAGCHMEGIAFVLRTVSNLVSVLETRAEWALMVRLLTGIQRYTEMNYIFKILKNNDQFECLLTKDSIKDKIVKKNYQFEYLLRKDMLKPAGFKSALLEWLRLQSPDDPSLLKMTVASFKMHKEEGALWEVEGRKRLQDLVGVGLFNNAQTKIALQTTLQDFSHAAECYLQADMLNHAMFCAHQAELTALQLHMLLTSEERPILSILLLDSKSVSKLITTSLSCQEAQIVARAYNHRVDWGAVLFYHCVSPGLRAVEYFSAWSSAMELTSSLAGDLARRFQRLSVATRDMAANMRFLLSHVQDMEVRYRIASELGFKDFVEGLLQAPEVVYLKDTVWQSGFKT